MIVLKRPMLAVKADEADLRMLFERIGPMYTSIKLDGVRALCRRNPETGAPELVSRTLTRIPNEHTQQLFAREEYVGLDGELCVGPADDKNVMQATQSGTMSRDGEPDVRWYIFDKWDHPGDFKARAVAARNIARGDRVLWLDHRLVHSFDALRICEEASLEIGYEGLILRHPSAPYKQGRSTLKQAWMVKMKRFLDSEAEVLGTIELMHNENEATFDERGYTKRSSSKGGRTAGGTLGALQVRDIHTGVEFELGTGFTQEQRRNLWEGRKYVVGKLVKYKYFPIGVKDKPRLPVFLGFRNRSDV